MITSKNKRKHIILFCILILGSIALFTKYNYPELEKTPEPLAKYNSEKIVDNGSDNDKLVFIILGDGYKRNEETKFNEDAMYIANEIIKEKPFDEYRSNKFLYGIYSF